MTGRGSPITKREIKTNYQLKNKLNMETKISNEVETCNLQQGAVMRSASVDIIDSDIATIEALHDLLLDAHGYQLDFITLKRARELTAKMYAALYPKQG